MPCQYVPSRLGLMLIIAYFIVKMRVPSGIVYGIAVEAASENPLDRAIENGNNGVASARQWISDDRL
jgi:hypothetical protein